MTETNDSFFEIHANDYYYGDKKELPKSLQREIHENMLYWVAHLHPNQKYTTENYDLSRRATDTALKYINALRDQLSKEREIRKELMEEVQEIILWSEDMDYRPDPYYKLKSLIMKATELDKK